MTIKEKVNQYLGSKGINTNAFEASIGASKSYWRNTKNISAEILVEVMRVYSDLSAEWLLRGKGEMTKEYSCEVQCDECSIIRERICELLEHVGLNPTSLSNNPLVQQKLDMQIKGRGTVSADVIYLVLDRIPAASTEWLFRGEGEMLKPSSAPATTNIDVSKYVNEIENLKREVAKLEGQNELLREQLGMPNKKKMESA